MSKGRRTVCLILLHLRWSWATRHGAKMLLLTQSLPSGVPGVPSALRASVCVEANSGWSPERGCGLRNKEEGREGLSRPLRAYMIPRYLPGLWYILDFGLETASFRSPPVAVKDIAAAALKTTIPKSLGQ